MELTNDGETNGSFYITSDNSRMPLVHPQALFSTASSINPPERDGSRRGRWFMAHSYQITKVHPPINQSISNLAALVILQGQQRHECKNADGGRTHTIPSNSFINVRHDIPILPPLK